MITRFAKFEHGVWRDFMGLLPIISIYDMIFKSLWQGIALLGGGIVVGFVYFCIRSSAWGLTYDK